MTQVSSKLRRSAERLSFYCPGCADLHSLRIRPNNRSPSWDFNGNFEAPTFRPSVLVRRDMWEPSAEDLEIAAQIKRGEIIQKKVSYVCHSFVTDGRVQFLSDCTHALANQTVPIPDLPPEYQDSAA